jgi:hypothetical protein
VIWWQHRWADVGPHEWPEKESVVQIPQTDMALDAYASQCFLVTNTCNSELAIDISYPHEANAPKIVLRKGYEVACPDLKFRLDALNLISKNNCILKVGETTCIWVQIDSHDVAARNYTIPIQLKSKNTSHTANIKTQVFPVRMPAVLDCTLFNYDYINKMALVRGIQCAAMTDLQQHYVNTFIINDLPVAKADANGNLLSPVDFSQVDKSIALYRGKGKLIGFFWRGDIHNKLGVVLFPELKFLTEPWKKAVTSFYQAYLVHLAERGLQKTDYFMYVYDENVSDEVRQVYALLKSVAPDVRLSANPTSGYKQEDLGAIAPYVDIWIPNYEACVEPNPQDLAFIKSTGKTVWIYSCRNGNNLPVYDYNLRRQWIAWNLGVTGIGQWAYADHGGWESTNSWEWVLGAFAYIYTKAGVPKGIELSEDIIPSKRWEAWREGAQDVQLLNMVKRVNSRMPIGQRQDADGKLAMVVSAVVNSPSEIDNADKGRAIILEILSHASAVLQK